MGATASSNPLLVYGQIRKSDAIDFDTICAEIALATSLTKGDVQNAITSLIDTLTAHLALSQSVRLGDLGTFRMSACCTGVVNAADFTTGQFRRAKIIFTPGAALKAMAKTVSYEHLAPITDNTDTTSGSGGSGGSTAFEV